MKKNVSLPVLALLSTISLASSATVSADMNNHSGVGMMQGQPGHMGMMNGNGMNMQNGQNRMGMRRGGMMKGDCMGMQNGQKSMAMMNGQKRMGMMNGGCMNMSMQRHQFVMQNGFDPSYQNKTNPFQSNSADILKSGKTLYDKNCAVCHGATGIGDGPASVGLTPKPANIAAFSKMPMASDGYLNWTISEGGAPLKSPMPAFKSQLSEQEIWQIISYLRTL